MSLYWKRSTRYTTLNKRALWGGTKEDSEAVTFKMSPEMGGRVG